MSGSLARPLLGELEREAAATRSMLERIPRERLSWQPHEKSMSVARLASHLADILGYASGVLGASEIDLDTVPRPATAETVAEVLERFDRNVAAAGAALRDCADSHLLEKWRLASGGRLLFEAPRIAALRGFVLSHAIHHRGQLSVYLRLLEVPLPQVYGPTADESSY